MEEGLEFQKGENNSRMGRNSCKYNRLFFS